MIYKSLFGDIDLEVKGFDEIWIKFFLKPHNFIKPWFSNGFRKSILTIASASLVMKHSTSRGLLKK